MNFDLLVMNHLDHFDCYYETDSLDKAKSYASRKATDRRVVIIIRDVYGVVLAHKIKGTWHDGEYK